MSAPIHLLWVFSTLALGGPQRRFLTLAGALGPAYRHSMFAMDGCYDALEAMPPEVDYARLEGKAVKGGLISRANLSMMRGMLGREAPDVLLTSNWGSIEWFIANRGRVAVPHLHFEDGFGPDERPDAQNPKRVWMRRLMFRSKGARFVAPSHVLQDVFSQTWGVRGERVSLIPNGVDSERFDVKRLTGERAVIGTVAALRREKRLDRMIDAVAAVREPDVSLLIVGDGPERAALEAHAQMKGVDAQFVGNRDDVRPYLAQMDVFAMSSDTEQMPISLVEAMMAGLPIVATDVGDIRRMVSEANREFIVPVDAEDQLALAMEKLCKIKAFRSTLGIANAAKARAEYGLNRMVGRYDTLFREMAGRPDQSESVHQTGT